MFGSLLLLPLFKSSRKSRSVTRLLVGRLSNCLGARFERFLTQSSLPLLNRYFLSHCNVTAAGEIHIRSIIFLEISNKVGVDILWIETIKFFKVLVFLLIRSSWSFGIYPSRLGCKQVSAQKRNVVVEVS